MDCDRLYVSILLILGFLGFLFLVQETQRLLSEPGILLLLCSRCFDLSLGAVFGDFGGGWVLGFWLMVVIGF